VPGLVAGEYAVPAHEMEAAVNDYKKLNRLHPKEHMPLSHVARVLAHYVHPAHSRMTGGALPLALGATMPILSGLAHDVHHARRHGHMTSPTLHHLSSQLFGSGALVRDHHHKGVKHWVVRGGAFKDIMGKFLGFLRRAWRSEPVKELRSSAAETAKNAMMKAITSLGAKIGNAVHKRMTPSAEQEDEVTSPEQVPPEVPPNDLATMPNGMESYDEGALESTSGGAYHKRAKRRRYRVVYA